MRRAGSLADAGRQITAAFDEQAFAGSLKGNRHGIAIAAGPGNPSRQRQDRILHPPRGVRARECLADRHQPDDFSRPLLVPVAVVRLGHRSGPAWRGHHQRAVQGREAEMIAVELLRCYLVADGQDFFGAAGFLGAELPVFFGEALAFFLSLP